MPRALPVQLESALDAGGFKPYFAIGKRTYTGTPPTTLSGYETLITAVVYYKYDGLELVVKYHSENLPADDGLVVGNKYFFERGVTVAGSNYTIKTASLRFDDYIIHRQIVTAFFTLFSPDEKPTTIDGDVSYSSVLAALNPNDYWLGTVAFRETPENSYHWGYQFLPEGKQVILKSYQALLTLIRQKYLLQAVDNSDDENEDEILFFHLQSPIPTRYWRESGGYRAFGICWSEELELFVMALGINLTSIYTSPDGINWTARSIASGYWYGACWSAELELFVAVAQSTFGGATVATSPDGLTWTTRSAPTGTWDSVTYSPELDLFVAVGSNCIMTSPDGVNWTSRTPPTSAYLHKVIWCAELGIFVAVGEDVITSEDGIVWTDTGTSETGKDITWSPKLELFAMATGNNKIATSPDAATWTDRTANLGYNGVAWSPELGLFCASRAGTYCSVSEDGLAWSDEGEFTDQNYYNLIWAAGLNSFLILSRASSNIKSQLSIESLTIDHTIDQGDVELLRSGRVLSFLWRDENGTIHTDGESTSLVHNLGYLESTDDPPASFQNSERGNVTVGIHLKYRTGDIFQLKINESLSSTYLGKVTEIMDPNHKIGWRCEIELFERFANTNAGALPSTIERVAAYTPLVTTNFDNNLNETVNNLQALADFIDDMDLGGGGGGLTEEDVQDIIGAMISGNTETGITVTYDDVNGKLNFVVSPSVPTTEEIQDIVGGMFTDNYEDGVAGEYNDADGKIELWLT